MKSIKTKSMALALTLLVSQSCFVAAMNDTNGKASVSESSSSVSVSVDSVKDWGKSAADFLGVYYNKIKENPTIKNAIDSIKENETINNAIKDFKENETVKQVVKKIEDNPKIALGVGVVALAVTGYYTVKAGWRIVKNTALFLGGGAIVTAGSYLLYKKFAKEKIAATN